MTSDIEYKRRWAKADATMKRKKRHKILDQLKHEASSTTCNESLVTSLTATLAETNIKIGDFDARERYFSRQLKGSHPSKKTVGC
jgi:hypothetical protein